MMETLATSSSAALPSSFSPFSIFPSRRTSLYPPKTLQFRLPSKRDDARDSDAKDNTLPIISDRCLSLSPLSKDAAMGLVLSAAVGRGWTTGSGMEGPSVPAVGRGNESGNISTFPWSLFTKSPKRRMLVKYLTMLHIYYTLQTFAVHEENLLCESMKHNTVILKITIHTLIDIYTAHTILKGYKTPGQLSKTKGLQLLLERLT
ncbi:uncharacterized protein LOC114176116 [Vigna unguiculata]|uniref:uncharacterized protein LOC114176116 n=1 Tax=Vigna unguiculata TaxID=3917 RepID=UPI0010166DBC|nr:uncharacterized protein LOC114176116 [Vigna unguiculata]